MIISKKINYLIILIFFGLWTSLGSDPYDFLIIFESDLILQNIFKLKLVNVINFFRALVPLGCLIICFVIIIKYKIYKNQNKLLYILLYIQIISVFTTIISNYSLISDLETTIDHIGRYHWTISSIATIFIFMIGSKLKNFDIKILFYISLFFIALMVFWFSINIIKDFIYMDTIVHIYNLHVWRESAFFLDHQMPRITGLSRSILFLYVVIFVFNIREKFLLKSLSNFSLVLLGSLIILFQSKYSLICFIIFNLTIYFISKDKFKIGKKILILFLLQILFFFVISNSRFLVKEKLYDNYGFPIKIENLKINKKAYHEGISKNEIDINFEYDDYKEPIKHLRTYGDSTKEGLDFILDVISSGRLKLWTDSFEYIKKRPFLGYGSMSDRIILNQKRYKLVQVVNPISNAYLYSLFSGGILSLLFLIYFWIKIGKDILTPLKRKLFNNKYHIIGTLIIFLLFLRCIIENSIMLFGVDFILLLNSFYLIKK